MGICNEMTSISPDFHVSVAVGNLTTRVQGLGGLDGWLSNNDSARISCTLPSVFVFSLGLDVTWLTASGNNRDLESLYAFLPPDASNQDRDWDKIGGPCI